MGRSAAVLPDPAVLEAAADRVRGAARRTPLQPSEWLSDRAGCEVHLKLECWQRTGSFKIRGALNAVGALEPTTRQRGLVTASAGNHGAAVARAARIHDATATIFVPRSAPESKKRRIRRAGAELREVEGGYDDAVRAARSHADRAGARFIHAFDDPAVVAGQATVGLEIADSLPGVREVLTPVGGGGLAAGVAAALALRAPAARVIGVQSIATRAMHAAFEAGRVVAVPDEPTLCDGLAGETEPAAFHRARTALAALELVSEAAVARAIRLLYREEGVVAEGAGAVGVAAILESVASLDGPAVVIVSGGNIDGDRLARLLMEA